MVKLVISGMKGVLAPGLVGLFAFLILYSSLKAVQYKSYTPYQILGTGTEALPDGNSLKLIQMNVFWRPWLLHLFQEEYIQERSQLVINRLKKYDICCLNEAFHFGSSVVKDFVAAMKNEGFKYVVSAHSIPLTAKHIIDSGVLILSKYPIIETASETYEQGCSWDGFAAKGAVYAKIKVASDKHVNVFATHLQASYRIVTDVDYGVRHSQSLHLKSFIERYTAGDDSPIFLLGDMNIDSIGETDEYQNLMKSLSVNGRTLIDTMKEKGHPATIAAVNEQGEPEETTLTQESDQGQPKAIDYVFIYESQNRKSIAAYESNIEKMTIDGKVYQHLSDHYAVECEVTLV